nr:hypothetical protein [uncultured Roseateles sp.]
MKRFLAATALGALALSANAQPWDGSAVGKVKTLDVTASENFGFRVYLEGQAMCTGGPSWAYVNGSDPSYKSYMSLLMLARAMDKTVLIYSQRTGDYCKIGYVSMQP